MGLFSKLFSNKPNLAPIDLGLLKTDMHSHLIPGIDDGSKSMEDSLTLIKGLTDLGYKKLITTPHIMSDYFRNTPEIILGGLEKVKAAVKEAGIDVELEAAAEYYLDGDFESKIGKEKFLTFGKNYLLFEVSYMNPPDNIDTAVFKLQMAGYKPILAHPERYPFWFNDFSRYESLKEKGVLFQLNINSLTGYYSPDTKKIAHQMIDKGMVDLLGTDCHHTGHINLLTQVRVEEALHKVINSGKLLNTTL